MTPLVKKAFFAVRLYVVLITNYQHFLLISHLFVIKYIYNI